jgi:hypothetical protein
MGMVFGLRRNVRAVLMSMVFVPMSLMPMVLMLMLFMRMVLMLMLFMRMVLMLMVFVLMVFVLFVLFGLIVFMPVVLVSSVRSRRVRMPAFVPVAVNQTGAIGEHVHVLAH